ncbi:hypothetical protein DEDE109153_00675 [Deinococcus deserti]
MGTLLQQFTAGHQQFGREFVGQGPRQAHAHAPVRQRLGHHGSVGWSGGAHPGKDIEQVLGNVVDITYRAEQAVGEVEITGFQRFTWARYSCLAQADGRCQIRHDPDHALGPQTARQRGHTDAGHRADVSRVLLRQPFADFREHAGLQTDQDALRPSKFVRRDDLGSGAASDLFKARNVGVQQSDLRGLEHTARRDALQQSQPKFPDTDDGDLHARQYRCACESAWGAGVEDLRHATPRYTRRMLVYALPGTFETREDHLDLLWEAGATGLEERAGLIRAYFDTEVDLPAQIRDGQWQNEADQDWLAAFKANLRPVRAGRVTIVPPWLRTEVESGQLPLVIEPGMAFGTGHHATTRMAVEALGNLDLQGKRVLDVGTGSGVLAIAAALLGAAQAAGVDIDPITIPIARENAQENGVPEGRTVFVEGTLGDELPEQAGDEEFDVLVANLYAELHDLLAAEYVAHLRPGGPLVLTGILTSKLGMVQDALNREGFSGIQVREDGEWVLVTASAPAQQ